MKINTKLCLFVLIIAVLLVWGAYLLKTGKNTIPLPHFSFPSVTPPQAPIASPSAELATVKRVIDGDTIELSDGRKVRYIGMDTPEMKTAKNPIECYAQEAKDKNRELVEGKIITIQKDVSEVDKYKRLLRYIWIGDIFINEYLVREGYARQATYPPDVKYASLFKKAVEEARLGNKGLWNSCNR